MSRDLTTMSLVTALGAPHPNGQATDGQVNMANPLIDGVLLMVSSYRTISEMMTGGVRTTTRTQGHLGRERHRPAAGLPQAHGLVLLLLRAALPPDEESGGDYWRNQVYSTF